MSFACQEMLRICEEGQKKHRPKEMNEAARMGEKEQRHKLMFVLIDTTCFTSSS